MAQRKEEAKLNIVLENNIRLTNVPGPVLTAIVKDLTIDNPEYKKRKARKLPTWGVPQKLELFTWVQQALVLPIGYLDTLMENIPPEVRYSITDLRTPMKGVLWPKWDFEKGVLSLEQKLAAARLEPGGVLIAPAGAGKTRVGLARAYTTGGPTLWVTHTKELLEQTKKAAEEYMPGIDVGTIYDGRVEWGGGQLIIATYQTLMARPKLLSTLNEYICLVVVDEVHHIAAECFLEVVSQLRAKVKIGLTATPERKDGLTHLLYLGIGPKRFEMSRDDLYSSGRLVKPEIRFHYTDFTYDDFTQDGGAEDLVYSDLVAALTNDEARLKMIVNSIASCEGCQIVISDSIRYCHKIGEALGAVGVPSTILHGPLKLYEWRVMRNEAACEDLMQNGGCAAYKYDKARRRWMAKIPQYSEIEAQNWQVTSSRRSAIMEAANAKRIKILIATGQLVQEGLDMPHLNHGHLVTPKRGDAQGTTNGASVEQAIGRLMRADKDNPNKLAVWHDYVDHKVGVLASQYFSRRKVYERLGLTVPRKPKTTKEDLEQFLGTMRFD